MKNSKAPFLRDLLAALIVTAAAAVAALQRPLFHDEASMWYGTGGTVRETLAWLDVHPPLYFLFTTAWFRLLGPELTGLRLVSCLLTGGAVLLFLRAAGQGNELAGGSTFRGNSLGLICATSPFLAFAGSFARYYGLVCFLAALALWLLVRLAAAGATVRRAALLGLLTGGLFLTNYPAAFLLGPLIAGAVLGLTRRENRHRLRLRLAFAVPCLVLCGLWMPFFLRQLGEEGPSAPGGAGSFLRSVVMSGAYLIYALLAGDGLPPWSAAGLAAGGVLSLAVLGGFIRGWRIGGAARGLVLGAAALLAGGTVLGALLLPGPRMLFLPPRVAFLCFPVMLLLALACSGDRAAVRRVVLGAVVCAQAAGLWGLLGARDTTVWAYRVPDREIAAAVRRELKDRGPGEAEVAFWYPAASLRNVLFVLGTPGDGVALNRSPEGVKRQIIVSETRAPAWPPAEAVGGDPAGNPPGRWRLVHEEFFLPEPPEAGRLKRLIAGREILPFKLRLQVYEPEENDRIRASL